jgi:hypothetical protein
LFGGTVIDLAQDTRTPWLFGRTEESLITGLVVSVTREASTGAVHVELQMRAHELDVISGKIAVAADTWNALVSGLPAAQTVAADGAGVRGRGLDFDATLALARRPNTDHVTIALRPASFARASCSIETLVDAATWQRLVDGVASPSYR